jgi:hypothetical protein
MGQRTTQHLTVNEGEFLYVKPSRAFPFLNCQMLGLSLVPISNSPSLLAVLLNPAELRRRTIKLSLEGAVERRF